MNYMTGHMKRKNHINENIFIKNKGSGMILLNLM